MVTKLFDLEFTKSLVSGILGAILATFIVFIFSKIYKFIYKKKKENKNKFLIEWIPKEPLYNKKELLKNINDYPKDYHLDFEKGEFIKKDEKISIISGIDCFKMHVTKFMNTEKDKYKIYSTKYGVSFLPNSKEEERFKNEADTIAKELLDYYDDWIKAIYSIKRYKDDNRVELALSVKGINEIIYIDIPILSISE